VIWNSTIFGPPVATCSCAWTKGGATSETRSRGSALVSRATGRAASAGVPFRIAAEAAPATVPHRASRLANMSLSFAAFVETDIGALRHLNFVAEQYSVISLRKRPAVRSGEEAGRARKFPSACQRVRKSMIDIAMNGLILLDRGDDVAEMGVSCEIPV